MDFQIGRTNDDFSRLTLQGLGTERTVAAASGRRPDAVWLHPVEEHDALVRVADRDGCVPDDFYSTTNMRTEVRVEGRWTEVERQRMDAVIVLDNGRAVCRKLREIRTGDRVICGVQGLRVSPEFRERDRADFVFMSQRDLVGAAGRDQRRQIAALMRETRARGRPHRLRRWPGGRPHRRRRTTSSS